MGARALGWCCHLPHPETEKVCFTRLCVSTFLFSPHPTSLDLRILLAKIFPSYIFIPFMRDTTEKHSECSIFKNVCYGKSHTAINLSQNPPSLRTPLLHGSCCLPKQFWSLLLVSLVVLHVLNCSKCPPFTVILTLGEG